MLALVFEKHAQRVADRTSGDAKKCHHVFAVQVGPFGVSFLLDGKRTHANFELVDSFVKGRHFVCVARGAVTSDKFVEVAEEMPGVTGIASHGGVFPAVLIAVEPTRQTDQPSDIGHERRLVAKLGQAGDRHSFTNRFVMIKGDLATSVTASRRLADVVQERSQS